MQEPTVIIDLSPIVRLSQKNDWRHVETVVKAWRQQKDAAAVVYGVADNSLWHHLDDFGKLGLSGWKKRGCAKSVPWADPVILDLATEHSTATIITTDLFRDHRRTYPWLQGTTRVVRPVLSKQTVVFETLDYSPIPDHEVSMRVEEADLKPKGINSPEARQALRFEWSCTNAACVLAEAGVIDRDPAYKNGQACCPECRTPAQKAGVCDDTRELVILLSHGEVDRLPVTEGTVLVVGRGRGRSRYDVRSVLEETDAAHVSREHLQITNQSGRLRVEDLGSRNGTTLIRQDGNATPLQANAIQVLEKSDRLSLARGALEIRLSGRKRARGSYQPDLTIPPTSPAEGN